MVEHRDSRRYLAAPFAARWLLAFVVVVIGVSACADDNANYEELAAAANELAVALGGDGAAGRVVASESPCIVSSTCPDGARVDLRERLHLSPREIADVVRELGWEVVLVGDRLVQFVDDDAGMSGSVSVDPEGRAVLVVGER